MTDKPYKKIVTVADVMTRDVISIEATATVHDAVQLMRENHTSSVIVARRDAADEFGIIAVADIAAQVLGKNLSPERVNVYDIMSKPVLTVPAEMNIVYAVRMLSRFQLTRAKTNVTVRHGQTIVLSGLFHEREEKDLSKVPLVGHIPIIGELFKSRTFQNKKSGK